MLCLRVGSSSTAATRDGDPIMLQGAHILVADDDPQVLNAVADSLTSLGAAVVRTIQRETGSKVLIYRHPAPEATQ